MPFIIRKIEPHYIGRGHMPQDTTSVKVWPIGTELGAITNGALASTLKQLASLLTNAEDIFHGLTAELTDLANRSGILCSRIDLLESNLLSKDPKKTPVPESDISTFATRKVHFEAKQTPTTGLFASVTRPKAINELYEAAVEIAIRSLDSLRRERDGSALDMYMCTPILGKRRRPEQSLEIESRVPAILDDLRKWTSSEALGDVTAPPDSLSRIIQEDDDAVDHKLPSPEEQSQAIALRFPAEIVAVDVSGRGFARMSMRRKSLLTHQSNEAGDNHDGIGIVKRRSRTRRPRGNRRNTLAGTDSEEIKRAINIEIDSAINSIETDEHLSSAKRTMPQLSGRVFLSTSTDTLGGGKSVGTFDALKAWGRSRLKRNNSKMEMTNRRSDKSACKLYGNDLYDSTNDQEMRMKPEQCHGSKKNRSNERKQSLSSLSGKSGSSIVLSSNITDNRTDIDGVILRESAAQKRERRKGNNNREDPLHSSSGNWSASSESGRASIGSETTTSTTHPNRSTSTTSTSTCSTRMTQNYMKRFRCRDTSTSSSITSEGTLTPDIIHDIGPIPFSEETEAEGETCSVYSCDTEGYYTSFHMDSGLKTLREEELTAALVQQNPLIKSNVVSPQIGENEYELFGRGSTSTTTSSAGTVCTALMAPLPPERKSSLTVVAMVHKQSPNGGVSPDSGHNTSSSPVESTSSPACCTTRSLSELEFSESSDLEGCDRIERIRSKTAISTSRIPSMCVITPPGSDDEQQRQQQDSSGSVLMSATVGTSQMKVINGDDKNLYATVQRIVPQSKLTSENIPESLLVKVDPMNVTGNVKIKPFSGVLGKLRSVLPSASIKNSIKNVDSGDYVTIADMRNNNDKYQGENPNFNTYANKYIIFQQQQNESEYVSLNELPMKADSSSLERKRHGARVTLDSDGKVIYTSDSLKRRREAHTTFNPGPFVKDTLSSSSMLARSPTPHRAITKTSMLSLQSIGQNENSNANKSLAIRANKPVEEQRDDGIEGEQRKIHGVYNNAQSQEDNSFAVSILSSSKSLQQQMPKKNDNNDFRSTNYRQNILENSFNSSDSQRNHFTSTGVNAVANRFFASSPIKFPKQKWNDVNELIKNSTTLSPISVTDGLCDNLSNKKKHKGDRTLSENDLDKIMANNILLRPPKSTMSNEELFSAIYKSKRKLNIKDKVESVPLSVENTNTSHPNACLDQAQSRHSWSPESSYILPNEKPKSVLNHLTSRRDFKQLLLQQSAKMGPNQLSATEQLKLSRQQPASPRNHSPVNVSKQPHVSPLRTVSPRATWKFQTPRSDVLSSTIIEDIVAEERAMKSSFPYQLLQSTDINNRMNCKRQLDLSEMIPSKKILHKVDKISNENCENQLPNRNSHLRTEFFAGIDSKNIHRDCNKFRGRSESPSHVTNVNENKVMSRNSNAPTLETAL